MEIWDCRRAGDRGLGSWNQFESEVEGVTDLAWQPGGSILAAAHAEGIITLLDVHSGESQRRKPTPWWSRGHV